MFRHQAFALFALFLSVSFLLHCSNPTASKEQIAEKALEPSQEKTVDAAVEPTPDKSPSDNVSVLDEPSAEKVAEVTPEPTPEPAPEPVQEVSPEPSPDNPPKSQTAPVQRQATYDVKRTADLVYAQGLVRTSWTSTNTKTKDLILDVYEPVGFNHPSKPVLVLIHGGGFKGGSKVHSNLVAIGKEFVKRGFVCFSINYRLEKDYGSVPKGWPRQYNLLYPAGRDAKAAIRWIRANAKRFNIDPNAIAVMGGSAGAGLAIMLGTSFPLDFTSEILLKQDPTLKTTNLKQSSSIKVVVNNWGGTWLTDVLTQFDKKSRFGKHMVPMLTFHGAKDKTVAVDYAYKLQKEYKKFNRPFELYIAPNAGHSAWTVKFGGKSIAQHSFPFVVKHLKLTLK